MSIGIVEIIDQGQRLMLAGAEAGAASVRLPVYLDAAMLWQHCPSALRRRQRMDGNILSAPAGVRITRVAPIGNYALNVAFSDGHDRGVYPWALLDQLSRLPKVSDYLIAFEPEPVAAAPASLSLA